MKCPCCQVNLAEYHQTVDVYDDTTILVCADCSHMLMVAMRHQWYNTVDKKLQSLKSDLPKRPDHDLFNPVVVSAEPIPKKRTVYIEQDNGVIGEWEISDTDDQ